MFNDLCDFLEKEKSLLEGFFHQFPFIHQCPLSFSTNQQNGFKATSFGKSKVTSKKKYVDLGF